MKNIALELKWSSWLKRWLTHVPESLLQTFVALDDLLPISIDPECGDLPQETLDSPLIFSRVVHEWLQEANDAQLLTALEHRKLQWVFDVNIGESRRRWQQAGVSANDGCVS